MSTAPATVRRFAGPPGAGLAVLRLAALLVAIMSSLVLRAQMPNLPAAAKADSCAPAEQMRAVAERPAAGKAKYTLAVDPDRRVLLLFYDEKGKLQDTESLGWEPETTNFPLAALLPKDQVLLTLRRISSQPRTSVGAATPPPCSEPWRLWVALTVGFDATQPSESPLGNFLHVFREAGPLPPGAGSSVLNASFPDGAELIVDDINADGRTEIAVEYPPRRRSGSDIRIWKLEADGRLAAISLDNVRADLTPGAKVTHIGLADYRASEAQLYTEEQIVRSGRTTVTRREYAWDEPKQRYLLHRVAKSQEIPIQ